ncbi:unnamed protein product [Amoebophrya sp. A120]|nr:unnamed protein product [Amoebophrya sp. A120]|eukprot:GSA120T00005044001.1
MVEKSSLEAMRQGMPLLVSMFGEPVEIHLVLLSEDSKRITFLPKGAEVDLKRNEIFDNWPGIAIKDIESVVGERPRSFLEDPEAAASARGRDERGSGGSGSRSRSISPRYGTPGSSIYSITMQMKKETGENEIKIICATPVDFFTWYHGAKHLVEVAKEEAMLVLEDDEEGSSEETESSEEEAEDTDYLKPGSGSLVEAIRDENARISADLEKKERLLHRMEALRQEAKRRTHDVLYSRTPMARGSVPYEDVSKPTYFSSASAPTTPPPSSVKTISAPSSSSNAFSSSSQTAAYIKQMNRFYDNSNEKKFLDTTPPNFTDSDEDSDEEDSSSGEEQNYAVAGEEKDGNSDVSETESEEEPVVDVAGELLKNHPLVYNTGGYNHAGAAASHAYGNIKNDVNSEDESAEDEMSSEESEDDEEEDLVFPPRTAAGGTLLEADEEDYVYAEHTPGRWSFKKHIKGSAGATSSAAKVAADASATKSTAAPGSCDEAENSTSSSDADVDDEMLTIRPFPHIYDSEKDSMYVDYSKVGGPFSGAAAAGCYPKTTVSPTTAQVGEGDLLDEEGLGLGASWSTTLDDESNGEQEKLLGIINHISEVDQYLKQKRDLLELQKQILQDKRNVVQDLAKECESFVLGDDVSSY